MLGRNTIIAGAIAVALLVPLVVASCGKKGPPRPPPRLIPAPIADLRVRQTGDRLVLAMTYPAVTTSGLALPAIEALEVLTLRPRPAGGVVPKVEPAMFAVTAAVTKRLEGAELQAATRGGELVLELDAAVGSPLGPVEGVTSQAAAGATPTPAPTSAPRRPRRRRRRRRPVRPPRRRRHRRCCSRCARSGRATTRARFRTWWRSPR